MSSKLKSSAVGSDSSTIEPGFQDGGAASANLNRDSALQQQRELARRMDAPHMDNYPPGGPNVSNDNYGKMGDNMVNSQPMPNYNGGGFSGRASNNAAAGFDQHGGGNMPNASGEYSQQSAQYGHYGQGNARPGYGANPGMQRPPSMGARGPGMSPNMVPPNYGSNQQRFMSGATIQQQGGPTPTLNQLLQNNSPGPRYQGNYNDYNMGGGGGGPGGASQKDVGYNPGWNGPPQRPGMHPYQQMQQGNYRNQVSTWLV
ncbi:hypothetical protein CAPTEDRAFT_208696 [Capitella teleta]|uniref:Uncharacterized protein n=1 Tax=Capitella teleta TaxID=283909 RepID=R7TP37_CAPTE|nr:hypothetical protein CAPTEDRAFT_208696 [Capitella teleta]|eukprot:ELT95419.1 hypothetical protein CAPTEDRAFT_208696 [Capitella teleta]